jgi:hypothetical protein
MLTASTQKYTSIAWALWRTRDLEAGDRAEEMRRLLHTDNVELARQLELAERAGITEEGSELTLAGELLGVAMEGAMAEFAARQRHIRMDFKTYTPSHWYPTREQAGSDG